MTERTVITKRASRGDLLEVVMDGDRLVSVNRLGPDPHPQKKRTRGPNGTSIDRRLVDHGVPTWSPSRIARTYRVDAK